MAGAFTDAKKDKPGRFALAQDGTILLDEIGDVSPAVQVRLLRVLEEKVFQPLGSTKTVEISTDRSIVIASIRRPNGYLSFNVSLFGQCLFGASWG